MALSREAVYRNVALICGAFAVGGCGSGIRLSETVIATPARCPVIEVLESGDVELCHHRYAHWTGTALERDGEPVFVVNRGQITSGGHVVAKTDGDEITVFVADGTADKHVRVKASGKVLDENGEVVATISPAPDGDLPALVFVALIRQGVWLPALPPTKPARASAMKTQVIGAGANEHEAPPPSPCSTRPRNGREPLDGDRELQTKRLASDSRRRSMRSRRSVSGSSSS